MVCFKIFFIFMEACHPEMTTSDLSTISHLFTRGFKSNDGYLPALYNASVGAMGGGLQWV